MCLHPITIDNPYFGLNPSVHTNYLHDCTHSKIEVPCGHCQQCYNVKQNAVIQRFIIENMVSDFFFCTLTYNDDTIPFKLIDGKRYLHPGYRDLRCFIKRVEKSGILGKFKYYAVSEYGGRRHRPHFHVIFALDKLRGSTPQETYMLNKSREINLHDKVLAEWRRNIGSSRCPEYIPLCTYIFDRNTGRRNFDFHFVSALNNSYTNTDAMDNTAFYVSKYVLKLSQYELNLKRYLFATHPEEFSELWKHFGTRSYMSKSFGRCDTPEQLAHIRKGIEYAINTKRGHPAFINPSTGQIFGLSMYYKSKHYTYMDATRMYLEMSDTAKTVDTQQVTNDETIHDFTLSELERTRKELSFNKTFMNLIDKYC